MNIIKKMSLMKAFALFTIALSAASFMHSAHAEDAKSTGSIGTSPEAVVELFTSQGCSSCPPADEVLGNIKKKGKILALAWHVDYWDYIGWKDTFADPEFTQRQRAYARALRERQIYTPQAIVNGFDHVVGSSMSRIDGLVKASKTKTDIMHMPITITDKGDKYAIQIKGDGAKQGLHVHVIYYKDEAKVKITRGENRGETLTYHNIVVGAKNLGALKADGFNGAISKADAKANGADGVAILVQDYSNGNHPGLIHGAKIIR